jgi:hypothetical protein
MSRLRIAVRQRFDALGERSGSIDVESVDVAHGPASRYRTADQRAFGSDSAMSTS